MVSRVDRGQPFRRAAVPTRKGYHFSKDIVDKAITFIQDGKQSRPDKPWYLWLCPGANHAPHHAPKDYIEKYKGKFDDGYEAYRAWVLKRMIERGILPKDTQLTPFNPLPKGILPEADAVRPWNTLSDDEKRLFSRMAEVYAAFSGYTDVQIGRLIDYLEESGQLENTLIFYGADNGASGEGSPSGSLNENRFFNGYPDDIESNMAMIDKLGSKDSRRRGTRRRTRTSGTGISPFRCPRCRSIPYASAPSRRHSTTPHAAHAGE